MELSHFPVAMIELRHSHKKTRIHSKSTHDTATGSVSHIAVTVKNTGIEKPLCPIPVIISPVYHDSSKPTPCQALGRSTVFPMAHFLITCGCERTSTGQVLTETMVRKNASRTSVCHWPPKNRKRASMGFTVAYVVNI